MRKQKELLAPLVLLREVDRGLGRRVHQVRNPGPRVGPVEWLECTGGWLVAG
jgi:hypothetical protein